MKRMRNPARFAALLLAGLLTVCVLGPADVAAAAAEPVRVGFFAFDGYHMQDGDGAQSGYGYDIVQYMSGYTGLRFTFIGYDRSWNQAQEMLAAGEIDMLTSAQKTPARLERFDFSDRAIGTSSAILTVKAGNTAYILDDYATWSGMRVGMIEGNSRNERFAEFAVERGFTYTAVYYGETDAMLAALKAGSGIDAVITSNLRRTEGEWILAQFDPSPFYIMVQKGNDALLGEINAALEKLYAAMPEIDTMLMNKYYLTDDGANIAFTVDERAVIEASGTRPVTVGIATGSAPMYYLDAATGEHVGISMDILKAIGKTTGLRFAYLPLDMSQGAPEEQLKAGAADLVAEVVRAPAVSGDPEIILSGELVADSIVVVGRKGDDFTDTPASKTIAIPADFRIGAQYVAQQFPAHRVLLCDGMDACMDAVRHGRADAMVHLRTCVSYLLQDPHYEKLEIIPAFGVQVSTCLAGLSADSALLTGIIDKGLAMIPDAERNAIMMDYTILNPYEPSVADLLYEYRLPLSVIAVLSLFVVAVCVQYAHQRHKNARALQQAYGRTKDALLQAEAATRAKSDFLARMSHDIRTPMNAIVGLTEIAKQHKSDAEKIDGYLGKIEVSSKMLLSLINDVLDMSAIEAGRLKIGDRAFDVKQVLTGVSTVYYAQCRSKGVAFSMEVDIANETLLGDALRVEQILMNLVSNAFKFTPAGGRIDVRVQETAQRDDAVYLRFSVSDTGCGMSRDMQARMFEPFEQESVDTARRYGGSGLGLAIVKNLVDIMHGALHVESEVGRGTTITVDLPFKPSGEPAPVPGGALDQLRVLSVDDDASALEYSSIVLNRIGVRFDTARSGDEALALIAGAREGGKPYGACLIDWRMDGIDGIELTRRIRAAEDGRTLIIIVSAYDLGEIADAARSAGADHLISKPLFQSTVFNVLMSLTGGQLMQADAPAQKYDFSGCRALLAEDHALNAEIAMELLELVRLETDHVGNGKQAVERFAASAPGTYDVILMDVQMPLMDGYAATRAIRALDRPDAGTIPILAMTANAFSEDVAAALSAGMTGHIAKPIETGVLYDTLAGCLKTVRLHGEKRRANFRREV